MTKPQSAEDARPPRCGSTWVGIERSRITFAVAPLASAVAVVLLLTGVANQLNALTALHAAERWGGRSMKGGLWPMRFLTVMQASQRKNS